MVPTVAYHLQAYRDCDVAVVVIPGTATVWVPEWACTIASVLFNTLECQPILQRAVTDSDFRAAVETILRTSTAEHQAEAVRIFATAHGVL